VGKEGAEMNWWGWIVGGAILLGAELAFVSAQFYLVFVGGAAILVGLATALIPSFEAWAQWAAFAVLALFLMVTFRSRLYERMRRHPPVAQPGPIGGVMTLPVSLAPGESCRAEHSGTFWTVCNDSDKPIPAGERAQIERVQGLTLLVKPNT
jgi:membrane protein implicated in regulation of membrane protease activity